MKSSGLETEIRFRGIDMFKRET